MKLLLSSILLVTLTVFAQTSVDNESNLRVLGGSGYYSKGSKGVAKGSKVKKSKAVKSEKAAKGDKTKATKATKTGVEGSKTPKGNGGKINKGGYYGGNGGGKGSKGGGKGSKGGGDLVPTKISDFPIFLEPVLLYDKNGSSCYTFCGPDNDVCCS